MKLLFLLWILPLTLGETHVTCVYSEECLLPCKSSYFKIIHWYKDKVPAHSFYHNADQLGHQSEEYKGRTSLLPQSEINNGNVSLLLKNIKLQDRGRYKCYTANDINNNEQFISVSVEARVKSVDITLVNETVTCNSSGVYPEPDVLWSSSIPLTKEASNTITKTEENLFTVTSILEVGATADTYKYNCSIINKDTTKIRYTAILEQQGTSDELTFECPVTKGFECALTFSSTTILKYDSNTSLDDIPEQWRDKITVDRENRIIKLSHLNEEQSGNYTWDCSTAQHRLIQIKLLKGGVKTGHIMIGIFITVIIIIFLVGIGLFLKRKLQKISKGQPKNGTAPQDNQTSNHSELQSLNSPG